MAVMIFLVLIWSSTGCDTRKGPNLYKSYDNEVSSFAIDSTVNEITMLPGWTYTVNKSTVFKLKKDTPFDTVIDTAYQTALMFKPDEELLDLIKASLINFFMEDSLGYDSLIVKEGIRWRLTIHRDGRKERVTGTEFSLNNELAPEFYSLEWYRLNQ